MSAWRLQERRNRLLVALCATCALALALLATRVAYSGSDRYSFLAWNLFLALIPLVLALAIEALARRGGRILVPVLVVLWVLFLPNAPYIVTDFVHLAPDPPVPLWFDVLLLMTFAWAGLLLGFVSLHILRRLGQPLVGPVVAWALVVVVLAASSLAIYLGRFAEANSWDLLVQPLRVLRELGSVPSLPRLAGVTAGFTAFLVTAYATLEALISSGERAARR